MWDLLPGASSPHLSWVVSASPFVLLLSADQSWRSRSLMNSAFQSSVAIPICQPQPWPASACLSLVTCELKALSTLCTLQSRELHLFIARAEAGFAHKQHPPPEPLFPALGGGGGTVYAEHRDINISKLLVQSLHELSLLLSCESLLLDDSLAGKPDRTLQHSG